MFIIENRGEQKKITTTELCETITLNILIHFLVLKTIFEQLNS